MEIQPVFKVKRIFDLLESEKKAIEESSLPQIREKSYLISNLAEKFENSYHGAAFDNHTLFVFKQKVPILTLPMYLKNGECSFFGRPLDFIFITDITSSDLLAALYQVREFLQSNKTVYQKLILYSHPLTNKVFGLSLEIPYTLESHGSIDLSLSEELIKKGIRQSYKSLINWGKTNLSMQIIDSSNCTLEKMEEFRLFHQRVAGKETRSIETWEIQREIVNSQLGFLVYAYFQDKLVSANMILGGTETCLYGVSVNDRQLMRENLPIGHYPIYLSILHAKEIGFLNFSFSIIASSNFNEKENDIAKFKRGFSGSIENKILYEVSL